MRAIVSLRGLPWTGLAVPPMPRDHRSFTASPAAVLLAGGGSFLIQSRDDATPRVIVARAGQEPAVIAKLALPPGPEHADMQYALLAACCATYAAHPDELLVVASANAMTLEDWRPSLMAWRVPSRLIGCAGSGGGGGEPVSVLCGATIATGWAETATLLLPLPDGRVAVARGGLGLLLWAPGSHVMDHVEPYPFRDWVTGLALVAGDAEDDRRSFVLAAASLDCTIVLFRFDGAAAAGEAAPSPIALQRLRTTCNIAGLHRLLNGLAFVGEGIELHSVRSSGGSLLRGFRGQAVAQCAAVADAAAVQLPRYCNPDICMATAPGGQMWIAQWRGMAVVDDHSRDGGEAGGGDDDDDEEGGDAGPAALSIAARWTLLDGLSGAIVAMAALVDGRIMTVHNDCTIGEWCGGWARRRIAVMAWYR